jgi:hypothetical protein
MGIAQVPQVNFNTADNLLNSQSVASAASDPQLFKLLLEQQINKSLDSLFGNSENSSEDNLFGSTGDFTSLLPGMNSSLSSYNASGAAPDYEAIARAYLFGKGGF